MAGFSDAFENKVLNFLFGAEPLVPPGTWHLALFTNLPQDNTLGTEVSGGSYVRAAIPNTTASFPTTTNGEKNFGSATPITFPLATADWGSIVGAGLYEAATGGGVPHVILPINPAIVIKNGDTLKIPNGTAGLRILLD